VPHKDLVSDVSKYLPSLAYPLLSNNVLEADGKSAVVVYCIYYPKSQNRSAACASSRGSRESIEMTACNVSISVSGTESI